MFQIVVCSGGPSGLIFVLSLFEILSTKGFSGKILLYHEGYQIRNSKNQLFLINETEFSRLPQSVRDYITPIIVVNQVYLYNFEDRLLELITKLDKSIVEIHWKR